MRYRVDPFFAFQMLKFSLVSTPPSEERGEYLVVWFEFLVTNIFQCEISNQIAQQMVNRPDNCILATIFDRHRFVTLNSNEAIRHPLQWGLDGWA